jgi:hypothetical protein
MASNQQETQEGVHIEDDSQQGEEPEAQVQQEESVSPEEATEQKEVQKSSLKSGNGGDDRAGFVHGLLVGLGIACIATFVIMWVSVFFTPQLPSTVTYEAMLAVFIYPLIYLLAVGLVALTAGVVREYFSIRNKI